MLRALKLLLLFLVILVVSQDFLFAQVGGVAANFGIDSSCYSGGPVSDTDDWFQGLSGDGVLDESNATTYYNQLSNNQNISFDVDMDVAKYSRPNGYILYDAKFIRDQIKLSGSNGDGTTFTGAKNGQNPEDWTPSGSGNVSGANDIVDGYIHMRRDGATIADNLWMMMGVTTLETNGDHYFDFEMYFSDLTFTGTEFINAGPDEGHNSWDFDAGGEIIQTGDLTVGFAVSGGGITNFEVRIWTSRWNFNNVTPAQFTWGSEFDGAKNNSIYGYASIVVASTDFFAVTNGAETLAPPWGTHIAGAQFSTTYPANYFAEVAVNLSAIGLNNFLSLPGVNPCLSPFAKVMAKSRSSQSFTSALGDFTNPVEFSANSLIDSSSSQIADLYSCDSAAILVPTNPVIGAYYEWTTINGLFENGTQIFIGDTAIATLPGTYTLSTAPLAECVRGTTDITIDAHPCAVDDIDTVAFNSTNNILLVLDNDYDLDLNLDISTIDVSGLLIPSNGTLSTNTTDGTLIYTPDNLYVGLDSFEYRICDVTAKCDTAFVLINVIVENCYDNIDNNADGLIDCFDPICLPTIDSINIASPYNCPILSNGFVKIYATGTNLEYSIDGGFSFYPIDSFYNLISGSYDLVVQDSVSGCFVTYPSNPIVLTDPTCTSTCDTGCPETYRFNWWDGGAGQQWMITNGETSLQNNYTLTGAQGDVDVDITMTNNDGQIIDFSNCGTAGNHFYTATCDDPNAGVDCDGDPGTTDGQFSYGCDVLTFGITSNNSSEETSMTFEFDNPTKICELIIGDVDFDATLNNDFGTWQDEIQVTASNMGAPVDINVVHGGGSTVSNNNTSNVVILSNYTLGIDGNLSPNDVQGHASISTLTEITSFTITYSNGPNDDGLSDDHAIWISSFDVCPSIGCRTATTNPHVMYYRKK